ncbi:MAG TPA: TolC family outer membrane protein, partial [Gammaproteobacteria bacterium]|nr:TolC family outer membrane protein [Gammaproteobacteria bacterium]
CIEVPMSNHRVSVVSAGWKPVLLALVAGVLASPIAGAATLDQALTRAWRDNPQLQAQRAVLAAAGEQVDQAKGGYYPQIKVFGGVGTAHQDVESTFFPIDTIVLNSRSIGLEVDQALYAGGRIDAKVDAAEHALTAQQAGFHAVEEKVLLDAARAYMDVVQDRAVLKLQQGNLAVLQQALDAAEASYRNGEVTHTDVDQARARLAGAQAGLIQAQGALASSEAYYQRVIGTRPDALELPAGLDALPASEAEALKLAHNNYQVQAAFASVAVANSQAEISASILKPSVKLTGQVSAAHEPTFPFEKYNQRSIMLEFSMPLYSGGSLRSEVNAARHEADSRHQDALDAERAARNDATQAWQAYQTATAGLAAINAQITAAQSAYDGVKAEYREGERTTLDVLNAEQELLGAQVNQVRAQRDEIVAEYALKAATGQLTMENLKLPVSGTHGA